MMLKKCPGCARAILPSAHICDHCGHQIAEPAEMAFLPEEWPADGEGPDELADEAYDLTQEARDLTEGADDLAEDADGLAEEPDELVEDPDELLEEPGDLPIVLNASELQAPAPAAGPIPSATESAAEARTEPAPATFLPEEEQPLYADGDPDGIGVEPDAPAQPASAATAELPVPVPARFSPRQLATVAAGVAGIGIVLFAVFGARSSASPGEPAAGPEVAARRDPRAVAAPRNTAAAVVPKWTDENRAFWVGRDRRAAAFEVASANRVQVWMRQVRPVLVVRCAARKTEVFVFTDSAAKMELQDSDHTVSLRFDGGPQASERWPDSEQHDALFAPDGADLARRIAAAQTLEFGFTPHNAEPVVAVFEVAGLAERLAPAAKQCAPGTAAALP